MFFVGVFIGIILQASWGFFVYKLMADGEDFRKPSNIITMLLIQGVVLAGAILYDMRLMFGVLVGDIVAGIMFGLFLRVTKALNR